MGTGPPPDDVQQRHGRERRENAERREADARERAQEAYRDAREAETPELGEVHRREAELHERAVKVHRDAAALQRHHESEHSSEGRDHDERGSGG